jgi:hypothetical protein
MRVADEAMPVVRGQLQARLATARGTAARNPHVA